MKNLFTEHPNSLNETYLQHLQFAARSGLHMIIAGTACIIHALLPFIFQAKASSCVFALADAFNNRNHKLNKKQSLEVKET